MQASDIEDIIVGLQAGDSFSFESTHLSVRDMLKVARSTAQRHGFTIKTTTNASGLRVEKTRNLTPAMVAKLMRRLKDRDLITFPVTEQMLSTVRKHAKVMEKSYGRKSEVVYDVDVVDDQIEVCCMHASTLNDPTWKPNRITIESIQVI